MKLYTFTRDDGSIICEVRAENHDQALELANNEEVEFFTDFHAVEGA